MMSQQTDFGFQWGPAQVVRICCDERLGWVAIEVKSKKRNHRSSCSQRRKDQSHS